MISCMLQLARVVNRLRGTRAAPEAWNEVVANMSSSDHLQLPQPVANNVRKAQHHRRVHAMLSQQLHRLVNVDFVA
jgi:hypothetical protein